MRMHFRGNKSYALEEDRNAEVVLQEPRLEARASPAPALSGFAVLSFSQHRPCGTRAAWLAAAQEPAMP